MCSMTIYGCQLSLHAPADSVGFRHLWGQAKPAELSKTAETEPGALYEAIEPVLPLGLPFAKVAVSRGWQDWPSLPELFPTSFPGVKTSRDSFLVDTDLERLKARVADYFNADLSHEEITRRYPTVMHPSARFDPSAVRSALLARGTPNAAGFIRYSYRPFDNRWVYWEADTKLLDEKRSEYQPHVFPGNPYLVFQRKARPESSPPLSIINMGDLNQMNSGVHCVPLWLRDEGLGLEVEELFHHVLAVLHDPGYRDANAGALRMEWPRIPLPGWPDGDAPGAAEELAASAERGRRLAHLLDSETPVPGVTTVALRPEMAAIGIPATTDGGNMDGDDFSVTAGWGHFGTGDAVMPGQGRAEERAYTAEESASLGDAAVTLGTATFDICLNDVAYWRNVPAKVWNYKLGGYQVLKKWLSYREEKVLGRNLHPEEVQHFTDTARRIAAILGVLG